jgi:hypothetical protein
MHLGWTTLPLVPIFGMKRGVCVVPSLLE